MRFDGKYTFGRKRDNTEMRHGGKPMVDTLTYMSNEKRIAALMAAGVDLRKFRSEQNRFDSNEVDPSVIAPKGRMFGLDLAEMSEFQRREAQRIQALKERIRLNKSQKLAELKKDLVESGKLDSASNGAAVGTPTQAGEGNAPRVGEPGPAGGPGAKPQNKGQ